MAERSLRHCCVLVVEDEYMLADDLRTGLVDAGAIVLGPVGSLDEAIELIGQERDIDSAILDVNLGGELFYPPADLLLGEVRRSFSRPGTTFPLSHLGSSTSYGAKSR